MDIADILRKLMMLPAPSGYEHEMINAMLEGFEPFANDVDVDCIGNVIARFEGYDSSAPPLMILAHMDQVGFVIRQIEDGFLRIERLGGIPEKVLAGLKVWVRTDHGAWIPGVIGNKSHHITPLSEKYIAYSIDKLYIDIGGASNRQVLNAGVDIGNPCVYAPGYNQLLSTLVSGTSIDDRGGCAVLLKLAEMLSREKSKPEVFLVASVQEEFNLRGAMIAAQRIKPTIAICLDVCLSADTPDLAGQYATRIGEGPAISMFNFHGRGTLNGCIAHPGLMHLMLDTAESENIRLKRFAAQGVITDSSYVQLQNDGIATIDLCFPVRYTHTPIEICDTNDLDALARLLQAFLRRINSKFNPARYYLNLKN